MRPEQRPTVTPRPGGRARLLTLAGAAVAAAAVFVGLLLRGLPGAILLLLVAFALVGLTARVWPVLSAQHRSARAVVVLALLVLAGVKASGHA